MQRFTVSLLDDRHALIHISDRVAVITRTLKRPGKGGRLARLVSAYAGFDSQSAAIAFANGIKRYFSKAFCQVRRSERLATAWEVKIRYFNESALETLVWTYAENPAIVATADVTAAEAKRSIFPTPIESIRPVAPIKAIELAPVHYRSNRPKVVNGLSID